MFGEYAVYLPPKDSARGYESLRQPVIRKDVLGGLPKHTRRLLVDSRDRESGTDFSYQVVFGNGYRANSVGVSEYLNVSSVEMKLLAFPKITNESYVVVDIRELNDSNLDATNNTATRAYAVGFFDTSQLAPGDVKPIRDFYSQKVVFDPPLNKLDKLNVRFLKRDGNVVTVGETGGVGNNAILFEVVTTTT
jgi:hypothetical protein